MNSKEFGIIQKIFLEQLNVNEEVYMESKLFELGVDSIGFMILIVYLENELEIEIDIERILDKQYDMITVEDLIKSIGKVSVGEEKG